MLDVLFSVAIGLVAFAAFLGIGVLLDRGPQASNVQHLVDQDERRAKRARRRSRSLKSLTLLAGIGLGLAIGAYWSPRASAEQQTAASFSPPNGQAQQMEPVSSDFTARLAAQLDRDCVK